MPASNPGSEMWLGGGGSRDCSDQGACGHAYRREWCGKVQQEGHTTFIAHRSSRVGASIITGDQTITTGFPSRIGGKASRPWFMPAHGVVLGDLALQFNWTRREVTPTSLRKVELEAYRRFAPFDS